MGQNAGTGGIPASLHVSSDSSAKTRVLADEMLSQKGAMALAKRLEHYWHEKGFPSARFWAEPIGERFDKVGTYEIYRVTSNLVNGLPPRYLDPPPVPVRPVGTMAGTTA